MSTEQRPKLRRGFAALSPERRKEIASQGGKTAHQKGTAHQFTSEEARAAAHKGGFKKMWANRRARQAAEDERRRLQIAAAAPLTIDVLDDDDGDEMTFAAEGGAE